MLAERRNANKGEAIAVGGSGYALARPTDPLLRRVFFWALALQDTTEGEDGAGGRRKLERLREEGRS